ncbi:MAG: 16S rRNA (cytidine(1402)-2'-O)-methyltransferase [Pedobacter sp.]|nr:MAG: 16S rRNA (cytidine(1402)-2'-O)-methyltransferase [Pedobacter sp.]
MLYLIPTPIGNLKDITLRVLEILQEVDLILAEDTRTSSKLLNHYQINKQLTAYHQHNEHQVVQHLVNQMSGGRKMALMSDAGTPAISDPGFLLVRECVKQGVRVECLPGPTAFVPALVNSGLPANRFTFEGFLPLKKGRKTKLEQLATEERTIILYESPHRLAKSLSEMKSYFGAERQASVSRELTKMFEETRRGTLEQLAEHYEKHNPRGEIVIVIEGYTPVKKKKYAQDDDEDEA